MSTSAQTRMETRDSERERFGMRRSCLRAVIRNGILCWRLERSNRGARWDCQLLPLAPVSHWSFVCFRSLRALSGTKMKNIILVYEAKQNWINKPQSAGKICDTCHSSWPSELHQLLVCWRRWRETAAESNSKSTDQFWSWDNFECKSWEAIRP